jgi:sialate O-acetylesterase
VGNITYRYPPRKYNLPAGLLNEGKNHICIRVICCRGGGQITPGKPFRIFNDRESVELAGTWKYKTGLRISPCPESYFIHREPTGLYNAMIAPIIQFPVKGILWYQGESNGDTGEDAKNYAAFFSALIRDWREKSGRGNIPFLFVQLPLFGKPEENTEKSLWALIREAQAAALSLPATGMAAALDLGEWNDLHPWKKKAVGDRLALAAMAAVYGAKNSSPGPLVRSVRREAENLVIEFDKTGAGLKAKVQIYVTVLSGGASFRLPAYIEGKDCIVVNVSGIPTPEVVLYAWADNPADRRLCNSDDLPAAPFRVKQEVWA